MIAVGALHGQLPCVPRPVKRASHDLHTGRRRALDHRVNTALERETDAAPTSHSTLRRVNRSPDHVAFMEHIL